MGGKPNRFWSSFRARPTGAQVLGFCGPGATAIGQFEVVHFWFRPLSDYGNISADSET
jgi:hypothetical protein